MPIVLLLAIALAGPAAAVDHPIATDLLRLSDPGRRRERAVTFRSGRDPAFAVERDDDPRSSGARLEFLGEALGDGATGPIVLPRSLWRGMGKPRGSKGFKYVDRRASTGIERVVLKRGRAAGSLRIKGSGRNWPYRVTQPQGSVTVRFAIGDALYCAAASDPVRNADGRFVARDAPPPSSCGDATAMRCGDGVADGVEECDDGGNVAGDGCAPACELESAAALCAGVPTAPGAALTTVRVASGLDKPLHVTAPPLDPNRVFITEQSGTVRILENDVLLPDPFLTISDRVGCCGERGLLSLAFHPRYEENGRFFVDYTDTDGATVIARFRVSEDPNRADPTSEAVLLTIEQPFGNHNGGQLAFGPDGYLYVGMGDGGGGGDPLEAGQDDTTLLGKMLRLDVDTGAGSPPYHRVPPTNPDAQLGSPLGLVWAKGLRNPWRFSFDRATGDLYIADVGQNAREEVSVQPASSAGGENYGWDVFEGTSCFEPPPPAVTCPDPDGFTMPVVEYTNPTAGCSVTGGFVYRGCALPDLVGTYFYSDFCSAFIRTFRGVVGGVAQDERDRTAELAPGGGLAIESVTSFGEDARGELYIADRSGEIFKIVPAD
jgi:cysteine-rich repeat protein